MSHKASQDVPVKVKEEVEESKSTLVSAPAPVIKSENDDDDEISTTSTQNQTVYPPPSIEIKEEPIESMDESELLVESSNQKRGPSNQSQQPKPPRPYPCPHCDKAFTKSFNLERHIRSLHQTTPAPRPFPCNWPGCSYAAFQRIHLVEHLQKHTQVKTPRPKPPPSICEHCGRSFPQPNQLRKHLVHHSTERPFSCTIAGCTKAFKLQSELVKHQIRHQWAKPNRMKAAVQRDVAPAPATPPIPQPIISIQPGEDESSSTSNPVQVNSGTIIIMPIDAVPPSEGDI